MSVILLWEELKAQGARLRALQSSVNMLQATLNALSGDLKSTLTRMEKEEMKQFDDLSAQVSATIGIEKSAITLIQGIATQLKANAVDPAAVQKLADELNASATELAASILANSPAPAPVEPPPSL